MSSAKGVNAGNYMTNAGIYSDIAKRCGGDIYIGVVGPVRTGKSTFIKRFMDLLVMPNVENIYAKERISDELPQSGAGKTITTTEPKFVPAEAVALTLPGNVNFKMRMIDCVGYMVPGVMGHMENGKARMVTTPWKEEKLPFEEAAEMGTRKVIRDHSTIGVVVTSDGSTGDLPRENYEKAEQRVIEELKVLNKPFVVVLNSLAPESERCGAMAESLKEKYKIPVVKVNCARMSTETATEILQEALYQFPVSQINFNLPGFTTGLEKEHWIKAAFISNLREWMNSFENMEDVKETIDMLIDNEVIEGIEIVNIDLATGIVEVRVDMAPELFYRVIEEITDREVKNDYGFFQVLKEFSESKKSYDKLSAAMEQVEACGYGIVQPPLAEMILSEPEIFKQGSKYGVRLKATAPSMHIIKTDISTEVSPVVGTEKQSEDLIRHLMADYAEDREKLWQTNIFGKELHEMVAEQMESKITSMPEALRTKVQKSLQKISDEGKEYFICIVL